MHVKIRFIVRYFSEAFPSFMQLKDWLYCFLFFWRKSVFLFLSKILAFCHDFSWILLPNFYIFFSVQRVDYKRFGSGSIFFLNFWGIPGSDFSIWIVFFWISLRFRSNLCCFLGVRLLQSVSSCLLGFFVSFFLKFKNYLFWWRNVLMVLLKVFKILWFSSGGAFSVIRKFCCNCVIWWIDRFLQGSGFEFLRWVLFSFGDFLVVLVLCLAISLLFRA